MPVIYDYECRSCGARTELNRRPAEGTEMRHMKEDGTVCGTFRRVWTSINVNRANIRAVPRG
jgi:predicted nucleic acid-binding Zn ribbon protein